MPPSQLKRLKTSLREQGVTAQQISKKKRKQQQVGGPDLRARKAIALASIREDFNPFEIRGIAKARKFDVTTVGAGRGQDGRQPVRRPGISKSHGETKRREKLLLEMRQGNKVGGIRDRRFGENDPSMTPDDRLAQRFAREVQKKKANAFDLEDGASDDELTHAGMPLAHGFATTIDDFAEDVSDIESEAESGDMRAHRKRKLAAYAADLADTEASVGEKTKAEVMKEVIAKSKLHKYERQQAKEDDEDLREELDKSADAVFDILRMHTVARPAGGRETRASSALLMNPERAKLIGNADRVAAEREYDSRLRELAQDRRAQPTERSKTAEEISLEAAQQLKDQTERRLRRMRGESLSESDGEVGLPAGSSAKDGDDIYEYQDLRGDAAEFGFDTGPVSRSYGDAEDEDDFIIDEDLLAQDSDFEAIGSDAESPELDSTIDSSVEHEQAIPDDDDLVSGLLSAQEKSQYDLKQIIHPTVGRQAIDTLDQYPITHTDFLNALALRGPEEIVLLIQRLRAALNPQLHIDNKEKLCQFAVMLVDHIHHMGQHPDSWPSRLIETVIRHIHSLSRTFPEEIATAFRRRLQAMRDTQTINPGDLVVLTAVGSIYPTSDHFHQVVTPAITIMSRWLGLTVPKPARDFASGAYLVALCLKYQGLAKRYIPELVRFTISALGSESCGVAVKLAFLKHVGAMADLWAEKSALNQIFSPTTISTLHQLSRATDPALAREAKSVRQRLTILLQQSRGRTRPLGLHKWRPLPIKFAVPKFEENYNPDRHYDPDRERHESNKLRAEYKKEKKGAMRELRRDANFIAREKLRDKKERDRLYEEKQRRLIAEINAEEGAQANAYERERRKRKGGR